MKLNDAYVLWEQTPTPENYEIFGSALLKFIKGYVLQRMRLPQEETKDDIVSRSVIRVLECLEDFDPTRSPFAAWVYRKIEDVRSEQLKEISERNEYPISETDATPDKFRGIQAKILLQQLIETLPVGDSGPRGLIRLQLEGFNDDEIAEVMGIPVGTVKSRWNRIRKKLRESAM